MIKQQALNTKVAVVAGVAVTMWFLPLAAEAYMKIIKFDLPGSHPAVKYLLAAIAADYILSASLIIYLFAKFPKQMSAGVSLLKENSLKIILGLIFFGFVVLMAVGFFRLWNHRSTNHGWDDHTFSTSGLLKDPLSLTDFV